MDVAAVLAEMTRTWDATDGVPYEERAKALYCQALRALEELAEFYQRFELVVVCRHCGGLADPAEHICGEGE